MSDVNKIKPPNCPHCGARAYANEAVLMTESSGGKPTTGHLIALAKSLVMQAFEEGFYAGIDNAETEQLTGIAGKVSECFGASKTWSRLGEIFGRADVVTKGASQ